MKHTRIAIVGGGLSGLYAAHLLAQQGHDHWVLLEARPSLGGRVLSVPVTASNGQSDPLDLGPSWFWPGMQAQLAQVVHALGLASLAQHELGDMVIERSRGEAPQRMQGLMTSPPSMRLAGGMASLVEALARPLPSAQVLTGQTVRRIRHTGAQVELDIESAEGPALTWRADHVLLALAPRLAVNRIDFDPPLPQALASQWSDTPTWMAPHAKYVAVYDEPFWRAQGLSGEARSGIGPMVEIHDASVPGGCAALFGFLGVPARVRQGVTQEVLRMHCRAQLTRLFGDRAASPRAELFKDWALDPLTATPADWDGGGHHPLAPPTTAQSGVWSSCLRGIGSEWSREFAGYVAGAIDAASLGVQALSQQRPD